jgi:hypothetical protein
MNIYISHSKQFDYQNQLYKPLLNSTIAKNHPLFLPHRNSNKTNDSKQIIKNSDLFIVESSIPSFGVGIEVGWANCFNIPIIVLYKRSLKLSDSIRIVSQEIIPYDTIDNIIPNLINLIKKYES